MNEECDQGELSWHTADSGELSGTTVDSGELSRHMLNSGELSGHTGDSGELSGHTVNSGELSEHTVDSGEVSGHTVDSGELSGHTVDSVELSGHTRSTCQLSDCQTDKLRPLLGYIQRTLEEQVGGLASGRSTENALECSGPSNRCQSASKETRTVELEETAPGNVLRHESDHAVLLQLADKMCDILHRNFSSEPVEFSSNQSVLVPDTCKSRDGVQPICGVTCAAQRLQKRAFSRSQKSKGSQTKRSVADYAGIPAKVYKSLSTQTDEDMLAEKLKASETNAAILSKCKQDCDSLLERQAQTINSLHVQLYQCQAKCHRMQCSLQLVSTLFDQLEMDGSESQIESVLNRNAEAVSQSIRDPESRANDLVERITTPNGRKLVIHVSKTYLRLRDLILEKRSLLKEIDKLKSFNTQLEQRMEMQERRLGSVTTELHHTWGLVAKLKIQHAQLHTAESVLRYELREKRKILERLRKELEDSRERSTHIYQLNADSEIAWLAMRREMDQRKRNPLRPTKASGEVADAAVPSSDELPSVAPVSSVPEDSEATEQAPADPVRVDNLEQQCVVLYSRLVSTTARQVTLSSRLAELHSSHGTMDSSTTDSSSEATPVEVASQQLSNSDPELEDEPEDRTDAAPANTTDRATAQATEDVFSPETEATDVINDSNSSSSPSDSITSPYPEVITIIPSTLSLPSHASVVAQSVEVVPSVLNLTSPDEEYHTLDLNEVGLEDGSELQAMAFQIALPTQVEPVEGGPLISQVVLLQDSGYIVPPVNVEQADVEGVDEVRVSDTEEEETTIWSTHQAPSNEHSNSNALRVFPATSFMSDDTKSLLEEVSRYLSLSRRLSEDNTNDQEQGADDNATAPVTHLRAPSVEYDVNEAPPSADDISLPAIGCKLISMLPTRMAHLRREREQLCARILRLERENVKIELKVKRMRAERDETRRRGRVASTAKRHLEQRVQELEREVQHEQDLRLQLNTGSAVGPAASTDVQQLHSATADVPRDPNAEENSAN